MDNTLQIYCFGSFEVFRGGKRIREGEWESRKAKSLFKYLVLNRHRPVPREELMELLWPDMSMSRAASNLWVAVCVLRRCLEQDLKRGPASRFVSRYHEFYRFEPAGACWLDVAEFEERTRVLDVSTSRLGPEGVSALEEAVRIYQGDLLLDDRYEDWTERWRQRFRDRYLQALEALCAHYMARGDIATSIRYCRLAIEADAAREEFHRKLMELYALAGKREMALRQFDHCRRALEEELGVPPASETISLYNKIAN